MLALLSTITINIDPVLIKIGGLSLRWYGLMYVAGIALGMAIMLPYARKLGISSEQAWNIFWGVAIASLIGGRLYYVVQSDPGSYLQHPGDIFAFWQGGMAFYGAIYTNAHSFAPLNTPVQPAAAYELLFSVGLFAVLWPLRFRLRPAGMLFVLYLSLYCIGQFIVFIWRDNPIVALNLKQAQVTAVIVQAVLVLVSYLILERPYWFDPAYAGVDDGDDDDSDDEDDAGEAEDEAAGAATLHASASASEETAVAIPGVGRYNEPDPATP